MLLPFHKHFLFVKKQQVRYCQHKKNAFVAYICLVRW